MQTAPSELEDAIEACAAGDRSSLERLYAMQSGRLLGVALRIMGARAQAEDAIHDSFVQIWQRAETFDRTRGSAEAWMTTIVRNRALTLLRRAGREVGPDELPPVPSDRGEEERDLMRLADRQSLYRCLASLEAPKRRSILLAYVDGYSHSQISSRLGAPIGTVKAWIRRALLSLKACLA